MKIAIAALFHETNTYCRDETPATDFEQYRGEELLSLKGSETGVGGALEECEQRGAEVVPLLLAWAQPSGTIAVDAYEGFKQEILEGLAASMPLDGVYLDLHGAGVVHGIDDLEGDLTTAIRELVGDDVPLVAAFDLHGNVTQRMADALDGVFACHHYPHIDMHLRAAECIDLIYRMHDEGLAPVIHVEPVPMLMPLTTTFKGIGEEMLQTVLAAESESGVIDVSWFHGFPYTDVPHVGSYLVVTTEGDRGQAERVASDLATSLWGLREKFRPRSLSAIEALAEACDIESKPVVINETSDNCGGGAPGDGTHLLRAMLEARLESACLGFIVDGAVAEQAHEAGVGASIDISLGGKYDDLHGDPIVATAYVKALHDGNLRMRAMLKGAPLNVGKMARLVIDGIDVVVASIRSQTFDIEPFLAVGIDVSEYDIVALKSSNHFRAGFKDIAAAIVTADPPGLTTQHIEVFERKRANHKLWPLDSDANYESRRSGPDGA